MTRRQFTSASLAATATGLLSAPAELRRVGIIGHTGRGNYGHGLDTVWGKLSDLASVVAVADADPAGLASAQKKLKLDKGYLDYHTMLSEQKPDIVAIGPRHADQHRDMLLAAIAAGARGIYIEKPFCRSAAEADEIIAAAGKVGTKIAIAHRNRYHPALKTIDGLIADGLLGKLIEIRCRGKEDKRGGAEDLWVLGSHLLNLVQYFGGQPQTCTATIYQGGRLATKADVVQGAEGLGLLVGNEIHASYRMERGFNAYFSSLQLAGEKDAGFGLQLIGTKGTIDLRIDAEPIAHFRVGNPNTSTPGSTEWQPITTAGVGVPEPIPGLGASVADHTAAVRDLFSALAGDRQPLCSAYDARVSVEMISAAFASHVAGGARISLPLQDRSAPLSGW